MRKSTKLALISLAVISVIVPITIIKAGNESTNNSAQKVLAANNDNTSGSTASVKKHNTKGAVVLYVGSTQALVNNVEKQVDKESEDVKPFVKDGRTLVPVRFIAESFGAKVDWNEKTSTINLSIGGRNVNMEIGKAAMNISGKAVSIDVPPEITEGRTYIPLRKLAEAFEKEVFYDRGLIIIGSKDNMYNITEEKSEIDSIIAKVNNLPVVGSFEKLKSILKSDINNNIIKRKRSSIEITTDSVEKSINAPTWTQAVKENAKAEAKGDYSTTNVQVQGVDEADIVKTDGEYIYQVNKGRIVVVKAYPGEDMEVMSSISFTSEKAYPIELYIDKKYMTVVASSSNSGNEVYDERYDYKPAANGTKVIVYDILDKRNIKKVREFEIDGGYVSSRKIGASVYLVSNKYVYVYSDSKDEKITPCYSDTALKGKKVSVQYSDIRYFPNSSGNNFMVISGINLDKMDEPAKVGTYLGAGQNIYSSLDNLYVSITSNSAYRAELADSKKLRVSPAVVPNGSMGQTTKVYKFSLNNSQITYLKEGTVPGRILNQFSMDENGGYFRIATTIGSEFGGSSKNNVYILDDILNLKGKIENIAPGERIYSTRFMGDRCYMVTFKKVDPFFVIDLKDPASPKILGALKIPGYSDYLHPYDENHIIGFGKDTEVYGSNAYYQGMKIALFDVTDVSNPVQKFQEIIGDRGTDSELLRNHKALLFSKEKNLIAFPVNEMKIQNKNTQKMNGVVEYGSAYFQGAYVYNIDLVKGFTLKGKITHMSDEDTLKSGQYDFNHEKSVQRILYIGDTLYTLSNSMIKANDLKGLTEKKSVLVN
ncbi:beta-propeller domain-containing protein [Pseudobacteroides cellulosolvens]|uniref:Beta propeller domain-containing protein n=1 Tax=Pseudobacteroides cellulosolvens ATCC 35603 = DSM 2933 TaxID=398512 RepID=A0A0L6JNQ9_9FIRM|nr:beta-propeller domain-containing protein [Pseudobacteroides cellulosolvens]KNY27409.1 Beta propeller domain-containing protein [Pseudobacteroides cellulosolvens ATCC 35603 = DSM 2933]